MVLQAIVGNVVSQNIDCASLCGQCNRNDPEAESCDPQKLAELMEKGECTELPTRSFGAPPIGSTMVFGFKKCITFPEMGGIQFPGTMCVYMYGWVYPG